MKSLACGMALTLFLQLIQSKIDLLSISDRLCLSALIFCTVSAIGISVKSHIGASLIIYIMLILFQIANKFANFFNRYLEFIYSWVYQRIF